MLHVFTCYKVNLTSRCFKQKEGTIFLESFPWRNSTKWFFETSTPNKCLLHWDLFVPQVSGTKKLVAATAFGAFSLLYLSRHFRRRKGKRRALPPQWEPVGFEFQPLAAPVTGKVHQWFWLWLPHTRRDAVSLTRCNCVFSLESHCEALTWKSFVWITF